MKATQKRPGSMTLRALEAEAPQAPDVAPARKSLRDYMAGPKKASAAAKTRGDSETPILP